MKELEEASTSRDKSGFIKIVAEAVDNSLDTYLYIVG